MHPQQLATSVLSLPVNKFKADFNLSVSVSFVCLVILNFYSLQSSPFSCSNREILTTANPSAPVCLLLCANMRSAYYQVYFNLYLQSDSAVVLSKEDRPCLFLFSAPSCLEQSVAVECGNDSSAIPEGKIHRYEEMDCMTT